MKIAVTGASRGIGLSIKQYFESEGHEVIDFSRSTGFNISSPVIREKIVSICKDYDIFVNNAYSTDGSQFSLLKKIHTAWQGQDKIIINISSRFTTNKDLYCIHKRTLDDFCNENVYQNPFIINIKPGLVDTDRVRNITGEKMVAENVVQIIAWALQNPLKIHSISFGK
jgi:hypothetical protein